MRVQLPAPKTPRIRFSRGMRSWLRAGRQDLVADARVITVSGDYTLAAYAAPAQDTKGFVAYAKVFDVPVTSYWDTCLPVAKYCGQHIHAHPAAAVKDALDVALMSLINDGAVQSGWPALTGTDSGRDEAARPRSNIPSTSPCPACRCTTRRAV